MVGASLGSSTSFDFAMALVCAVEDTAARGARARLVGEVQRDIAQRTVGFPQPAQHTDLGQTRSQGERHRGLREGREVGQRHLDGWPDVQEHPVVVQPLPAGALRLDRGAVPITWAVAAGIPNADQCGSSSS